MALFGAWTPASIAAPPKPPSSLSAASWILVDPASGDVLAAQDDKTAYPIASATKLMTYYVAAEQLRPAREVVAAPYDPEPGESLAGFEPGDSLTARDVFYGLMVPSGNDAALTLALAVSGSESDFVSRMNAAADDLGLAETDYLDPIGLSPGNVSSARDLVGIATELREQRLFREIVDTRRITLRSGPEPIRIENRNALVLEEPFIDGIKTGTTLEAGYVLVASGARRGVELISVVLGAPDEGSRDAATLELFDYGFSLYRKRTLVERGERVGFVPLAEGGRLPLDAAADLEGVARAGQEVEVKLQEGPPVSGPLAVGDPVGVAQVSVDGRKVGEVDALAAQAVTGLLAAEPDDDGEIPASVWVIAGIAVLLSAILALTAVGVHRRE